MTGNVVRVNKDKGFFFIKPTGGGEDRFAHMSSLMDSKFDDLREGMMVRFEDTIAPKGPRAENVYTTDTSAAEQFERIFQQ